MRACTYLRRHARRAEPLAWLVVPALLAASACGSDATPPDDAAGDDATTDGGDADADADSDSDSDSDGYEPPGYPAGAEIQLVALSANQGSEIPIDVQGQWVALEERPAPIISGRDTFFRAYWDIDEAIWEQEGFETRSYQADLTLNYPDGTSVVFPGEPIEIGSDSVIADKFSGAFWWGVPASRMVDDTRYHVAIYELEPGAESLDPSPRGALPVDGEDESVGLYDLPMQLKVVMVPVVYDNLASCQESTAELGEDIWEGFRRALLQENPAQDVIMTIREQPIVYTGNLEVLSYLFPLIVEAREQDGADANTYYYALIDPCKNGVNGASGVAPTTTSASPDAGNQRIAVGVWGGGFWAFGTFVHEIGHTQGMAHVYCPGGGADSGNPDYPEPTGKIQAWGFGIRDINLRAPANHYDYMSYCGPSWPGQWTWNHTAQRIAILSSWDVDTEAPEVGGGGLVLAGVRGPGGDRWWIMRGEATTADTSTGYVLSIPHANGDAIDLPVRYERLDDGSEWILAPLPPALAGALVTEPMSASLRTLDQNVPIDTAEIRDLRPQAIAAARD